MNDEDGDETDDLLERNWTGLCYTAALRWASVADDPDWVVVHGTVLSERVGKRIEHAWCERAGFVVDLALPVGARVVKRDVYYRVLKPEVSRVYSAEDALLLVIKKRHDGPWDESEQLKE